jgi:chemotaxis protein methyltransferase CheR
LQGDIRRAVELRCEDLRAAMPAGPFDLVLCRNLVFTYFDAPVRERVALDIVRRVREGGVLVIGAHEELDERGLGLVRAPAGPVGAFVRSA